MPPKVSKSKFRDARKLFGVNCDNKVTLRNPGHLGAYEEIMLLQFDPNFMSTEVVCRDPSCNNVNPAAAKSGKRDLYLCPRHQQVLRNHVSDALAKESIAISSSFERPEPGHFAGYTSLISLLERAFHDNKFHTLQGKPLAVKEAILNVRNFLIITSTVLNPDDDNLGIALPPVVEILKLILDHPAAVNDLATTLINLLHKVIKMILHAFGVNYTWVSLALKSQVAQIVVCALIGGIAVGLLASWSLPGFLAGATMGGLSGWKGEQRRQEKDGFGPNRQLHYQYLVYCFNGDVNSGLDLHLKFQQ